MNAERIFETVASVLLIVCGFMVITFAITDAYYTSDGFMAVLGIGAIGILIGNLGLVCSYLLHR